MSLILHLWIVIVAAWSVKNTPDHILILSFLGSSFRVLNDSTSAELFVASTEEVNAGLVFV